MVIALRILLVVLAENAKHLALQGVCDDSSEVRHLQLAFDRSEHLLNLTGSFIFLFGSLSVAIICVFPLLEHPFLHAPDALIRVEQGRPS